MCLCVCVCVLVNVGMRECVHVLVGFEFACMLLSSNLNVLYNMVNTEVKYFTFFYETPHMKLCNTHTHLSICLWSFSERNGQQLVDTCNAVCNCSPDEYLPVCGSDGVMYYSACFAGCSDIIREDSIIKVSSLHMWSFIKVFHLCLELLHMACLAVFFPSWINTA